jgi:hypothetical protein
MYRDVPPGALETASSELKQVSFREQVVAHIKHHEEQLEKQKEMLKLLDENPAIEKFMDLSRR